MTVSVTFTSFLLKEISISIQKLLTYNKDDKNFSKMFLNLTEDIYLTQNSSIEVIPLSLKGFCPLTSHA